MYCLSLWHGLRLGPRLGHGFLYYRPYVSVVWCPCITDDEPPLFTTCPRTISVPTDQGSPQTTVTWTTPRATDNSGDTPTVTCSPNQGRFAIGSHTVSCVASDGAIPPNQASNCTFNITVRGKTQSTKLPTQPMYGLVSTTRLSSLFLRTD